MKLRSLELANFRRFRQSRRIDGFSDGLNIVVEPNEAGKSTLLEALRAAFFIRHSAKTELTRSYVPFNDTVAPSVCVEFEIAGHHWRVEKQFIRSQRVLLEGEGQRIESDPAEERLQKLLGFEKGNNRGSDPETRGALGLLWVEQASALHLEPPGRLVQDSVREALVAEVGALTGGRRFDAVKRRVDEAYSDLRTGRTRQSTGRLKKAEERLAEAIERRTGASALVAAHEEALSELEMARTARRLVERELGDADQAALRARLEGDLKLAAVAVERLATANALHGAAKAEVDRLDRRVKDFEASAGAIETAATLVAKANVELNQHNGASTAAAAGEEQARAALTAARAARTSAQDALAVGHESTAARDRNNALAKARLRLTQLLNLETELAVADKLAGTAIDAAAIQKLRKLEQALVEAKAVATAGAVRLELTVLDDTAVSLDGVPADSGSHDVGRPAELIVGQHAAIRIVPPGAGSAAARLAAAQNEFDAALAELSAKTVAEASNRAEQARAASERAKGLRAQIETLCAADDVLQLSPGSAALKALVTGAVDAVELHAPVADLSALNAALVAAQEDEQAAIGRHDVASIALHEMQDAQLALARQLASAERDEANARARSAALVQDGTRDAAIEALSVARQALLRRHRELDDATGAAAALDAAQIERRIANIDRAAAAATERRLGLIGKIAGLEATIAADGAKGLAARLAEALEEEAAAGDAVTRLRSEADILELLGATLQQAQETTSRAFLGPVTRRAVKYVNRLLPGCDVTFSEHLGLQTVMRGGQAEGCADLSRGTQEQLAILTRLAFADLLLERGLPVSLILDDPLVYSDDARLDTMTDILTSAAERMQVIVLTCRERAFRHLAGTRIAL